MRRILGGAIAVLVAAGLAGCAMPEPPDPAAVQEWLDEQPTDAGVGSMAALASKTADVGTTDVGEPEGIRIDLAEPVRLTSIEFSCFGAETMDAVVQVTTGSSSAGVGPRQVRCADGPVAVEVPVVDLPVSKVIANGMNEDGYGAWAVVIR